MTRKQYRTAMGKTVDMGALMLQNEGVRAVGNMAVNAKGDKLDSTNRIIDRKAQQINRQAKKQSQSSQIPASTSNSSLRRPSTNEMKVDPSDTFNDLPEDDFVEQQVEVSQSVPQGGLAAAIAKAKTVQQEKIVPPKQAAKTSGVRKL